ncbi:hypothetical protein DRN93_01195 [archaeon]|nr:MAG: hypothetical protein DRN93_01195 [archaeon]
MHAVEKLLYKTEWIVTKYESEEAFRQKCPFERNVVEGNLLLNEGIQELWDLVINTGGTTPFDNSNARLGVGDGTTAEDATQTGLVGSNTFYKGMDTGYPQRNAQTVTWRAVFASGEANFDWREFSVDNGSTAEKNLNRKVSNQGTKVSGQVWTLELSITLS